MNDLVPDLWPADLEVEFVLTPEAILRTQAEKLHQKTNNLLDAQLVPFRQQVSRGVLPQTELGYHFEIIAPALGGYRFRLFTVKHAEDRVYPAFVDFTEDAERTVFSQAEFAGEISRILASSTTRSVLQSLVAQSLESRKKPVAS